MSDASRLRDSTQIVLPERELGGLREELERQFTLSFVDGKAGIRIVGSPVEIKSARQFLARRGVSLP
jgi:hypothetical protein